MCTDQTGRGGGGGIVQRRQETLWNNLTWFINVQHVYPAISIRDGETVERTGQFASDFADDLRGYRKYSDGLFHIQK